jgi:hypothetical protein
MPRMTRGSDRQRIAGLGAAALALLLAVLAIEILVPSAYAPRVNVRWERSLGSDARTRLERDLRLIEGVQVDAATWSYDLEDPSRANIERLLAHPSVADTHHLDRGRVAVSRDAPAGRTRIRGGLSTVRDSPLLPWAERFSFAVLLTSALWLTAAGRHDHPAVERATAQRHTGSAPE